jgi:hypothetical protein
MTCPLFRNRTVSFASGWMAFIRRAENGECRDCRRETLGYFYVKFQSFFHLAWLDFWPGLAWPRFHRLLFST